MKKITSKVVALVLALALVVSAFATTSVFAASKTESGTASVAQDSTLHLVSSAATAALTLNIEDMAGALTLKTYDHQAANSVIVKSVSISGSAIYGVAAKADGTHQAKIRNKDVTGEVTINLLLEGTYNRGGENDNIVRGSTSFKVKVLKDASVVISSNATPAGDGAFPDQSWDPARLTFSSAGAVTATGTPLTIAAYDVTAAGGSTNDSMKAYAKYTAVSGTGSGFLVPAGAATSAIKEGDYVVKVNNANALVTADTAAAASLSYGLKNGISAGTPLTFSVCGPVATDGAIPTKKLFEAKGKVANTIDVATGAVTLALGDGSVPATNKLVNPSTGALIAAPGTLSKSTTYMDMTGVKIAITGNTGISTDGQTDVGPKARVGNIAVGTGALSVALGAVTGDITNKAGATTLSGTSGKVRADGQTVTIDDGSVAAVTHGSAVVLRGGKITGDVSVTTVIVDPTNLDVPASIAGLIKAKDVTVDSTNDIKATVGKVQSNAFAGTIIVKGNKSSIASINADYYDTTVQFDGYKGTMSGMTLTDNAGIQSLNESKVVVTGTVNALNTLSIDEKTSVRFDGSAKIGTISGVGTLGINAGGLTVGEGGASGVKLMLNDNKSIVTNTVVFKAPVNVVSETDMNPVGFSLKKSSTSATDTFSVDTTVFAGLAMSSAREYLEVGKSVTLSAKAFPAGQTLPKDAKIKWAFSGDDNYFEAVENADGTATVKALKKDATFETLNQGTLTATLYDAAGDFTYDDNLLVATCDIVIGTAPASFVSDTTTTVKVAPGKTYQYKVTTTAGTRVATLGTPTYFDIVLAKSEGNVDYYKVTAKANAPVGAATGVYFNGSTTPTSVVEVVAGTGYTIDTKTVTVAVGKTYQVKISGATTKPVVTAGSSAVFTIVKPMTLVGKDYFFTIAPTAGAKTGAGCGFYFDGAKTAAMVATVG